MTQEPLLEPLATMGVLVGATRRVKIGTAVLVMPYRHPVLLAHAGHPGCFVRRTDAAGGWRGLACGESLPWARPLPRAVGSQTSVSRLSDAYARVEVTFQGEHYQLDPVVLRSGSVQRPHPPILIGGTSNAALQRTARLRWVVVHGAAP